MKMLFRGFRAILLKEFTVIFRDPTTLFFMFFPPVVQIIAFGFALDNDVKNMAMMVFNEDRTVESRQLVDKFVNTQTFRVAGEAQSVEELSAAIREGRAYVGLQIPPDFTRNLVAGRGAQVPRGQLGQRVARHHRVDAVDVLVLDGDVRLDLFLPGREGLELVPEEVLLHLVGRLALHHQLSVHLARLERGELHGPGHVQQGRVLLLQLGEGHLGRSGRRNGVPPLFVVNRRRTALSSSAARRVMRI